MENVPNARADTFWIIRKIAENCLPIVFSLTIKKTAKNANPDTTSIIKVTVSLITVLSLTNKENVSRAREVTTLTNKKGVDNYQQTVNLLTKMEDAPIAVLDTT